MSADAPTLSPGDHVRISRPKTPSGAKGFQDGREGTVRFVACGGEWVGFEDEHGGLWPMSAVVLRRVL
jgi:hypothetical protein